MISALRSIWIWAALIVLIIAWLPLLALVRLFDRDPIRYRTGRWFRRLGVAMTMVNPAWHLTISGCRVEDPRRPYVVVANHQSNADIPLISHLPWEMKWVAKESLFRLPFLGWMMKLAGDISLDRADRRSGTRMLIQARGVLEQHCSVMFFPEGTRSRDGRVGKFTDGAFHLAVRSGIPLLPLAVDGSGACLPKRSWRFGVARDIRLAVLAPVETTGYTVADVPHLREVVRQRIIAQIAEWRNAAPGDVDGERGERNE